MVISGLCLFRPWLLRPWQLRKGKDSGTQTEALSLPPLQGLPPGLTLPIVHSRGTWAPILIQLTPAASPWVAEGLSQLENGETGLDVRGGSQAPPLSEHLLGAWHRPQC